MLHTNNILGYLISTCASSAPTLGVVMESQPLHQAGILSRPNSALV